MLKVFFGKPGKETVYFPDDWFEFRGYKFLGTDFSRNLIKDIDKCEYISDKVVSSSVMGIIPSLWLSTGSKMVMMSKYTEYPIIATWIGNNTVKYLREISKEKDITVIAGYLFGLFKNDKSDLDVLVLNTGKVTKTAKEFSREAFELIEERGVLEYAIFKS